jgi:predicted permease
MLRIDRGGTSVQRAVDDELQFHFEMTIKELIMSGSTPEEARRETERRFGDVQRTRERLATIDRARLGHEQRAEWWSGFIQDLKYAVRGLRLKPGFALAVIVTLGLGIGANATMFGIVDRLLFRPPHALIAPDRAGRIYLVSTFRGEESINSYTGYQRFVDIRDATSSFDALTPYYTRKLAVGTGAATAQMMVGVGGADLWKMFDIKPAIGRFFTAEENVPATPANVLVLSYGYWQTQYGGHRDVIGKHVDIGPIQYTIIGVTPEGFNGFGTDPVIGFVPIASNAQGMYTRRAGDHDTWYTTYFMTWFEVFGRRKPDVSVDAATADLSHAYQLSYQKQLDRLGRGTPIALVKPRGIFGPVLRDRGPNEGADAKVATWLGGVALIVLLIACANVANLLLARALRRRREIAVRIALGVSRSRLLMQLVTESVLLALLGGVAGLVTAQWGGAIVQRALLDQSTTVGAVTDTRVLVFIAGSALIVGLLTGLAPAVQAGRSEISATLKAGAREGTVHRSRLRVALLVIQAALSVVLLIGAGLFVHSLYNVRNTRLGYDADRLLFVTPNLRGMALDTIQEAALDSRLMQTAATLPGVEHAAVALTVPFWSTWQLDLFVPGIDSVSKLGNFALQAASPEIFQTLGTRIVRGRALTDADRANAPKVALVTEGMANKLWPGADAIGKQMRIGSDTTPPVTIVGITEDIRQGDLAEAEPYYFLPFDQFRRSGAGIFVRTSGPADEQAETVRRALQREMPGVSYVTVTAMSTILAPSMRPWKLGATMFAIFGALALVLAAIGLYSVIAYNVTQRMHEMGVRVALGAQTRDVIRLIVREGLVIVVPGILIGAAIALAAGRYLAPLLFSVSPKDPPVLAAVIVTLLAVAIAASWIPARRAAHVDPSEALRAD